jgi:hypothetical protein
LQLRVALHDVGGYVLRVEGIREDRFRGFDRLVDLRYGESLLDRLARSLFEFAGLLPATVRRSIGAARVNCRRSSRCVPCYPCTDGANNILFLIGFRPGRAQ